MLTLLLASLLGTAGGGVVAVADPVSVVPRRTTEFLDSLGVVIHPGAVDYPADATKVLGYLRRVGLTHVRTNSTVDQSDPGYAKGLSAAKALAAAGIGQDFTIQNAAIAQYTQQQIIDSVDLRLNYLADNGLVDSAESIEPFNEFDQTNPPVAGWSDVLKQQMIYLASQRARLAPAARILGPALVGHNLPNTAHLMSTDPSGGPINAYFDSGSFHSYPLGKAPETTFPTVDPASTTSQFNVQPVYVPWAYTFEDRITNYGYYIAHDKPITMTETGYSNDKSSYVGRIDEVSSGTYIPRVYLDAFRIGIPRTYLYELIDERSLPSKRERAFGLFHANGSPKPAATGLNHLTTLLAGGDAALTPTPLDVSVTSADPATPVNSFLLQKTSGEYWLAVWQPISVYDVSTHLPIARTDVTATVTFTEPHTPEYHKDLRLRADLTVPATPTQSAALTVSPRISLLRIR